MIQALFLYNWRGRHDSDPVALVRDYKKGQGVNLPEDLARELMEQGIVRTKDLGRSPENKAAGGPPAESRFPEKDMEEDDGGRRRSGRAKPGGVTTRTVPRGRARSPSRQ